MGDNTLIYNIYIYIYIYKYVLYRIFKIIIKDNGVIIQNFNILW